MDGIKIISSENSVEGTIKKMIAAIASEGWHLFAHIDHAAEAKKKGLKLRPTQVVLFGNPDVGTHLMQSRQSVAIDLPMKAMVWEDSDGRVYIGHNTLSWLQQRHRLPEDVNLQTIASVVESVCRKGAE